MDTSSSTPTTNRMELASTTMPSMLPILGPQQVQMRCRHKPWRHPFEVQGKAVDITGNEAAGTRPPQGWGAVNGRRSQAWWAGLCARARGWRRGARSRRSPTDDHWTRERPPRRQEEQDWPAQCRHSRQWQGKAAAAHGAGHVVAVETRTTRCADSGKSIKSQRLQWHRSGNRSTVQ